MDLLFVFIILGLLLYSGVTILYFFVKAFLPSSTQKRSSSQGMNSNRNQQRNIRRNTSQSSGSSRETSTGQKRNENRQATKEAWKSLTTEVKDIMNEMDGDSSKKASPKKRNTPPATPQTVRAQQPVQRSYEGSGSSEGTYIREGRGSFEGVGGREGTGSYEGTEFHPRGHSTRQRPPAKTVASTRKKAADETVSVSNLKKNLVNAVIYKEILDQPRSKRPIR